MGVLTLVSSNSNNTSPYVFNAFSEYVTCVCVSTLFRISVVSLSDGKLLIFDNDKHRLHRHVYLGEYIFHIIICPSSGYILCKAQHEYFVVSINGSIIKRCPFDRMTYLFCTWTDNNSVDYVCSSDQQGNIVVFESFFPEKLLFAAACGSRTLCIKYDKYSLGLCVFTEKSQFLFYPFS
ncbi:hypothetical protein TVAG_354560 [Trichomonas vaginalis G3]|uniref:Uncharacterized protein n=1 Tax=Trichomonas vaginalis (strain ATCC PRA-98 / G3) TaxID=412133 RepID=A2FMY8_TRIV3|nr:platelet formation protein family [Trichomonas vaginalis G3]EAX93717.1 hypothetical protein TVAG_354560 [Trichomonas vaginalis G3]KAI5498732.1 platelet formation protein family [Trichomonas vaginalis G3]|eukprot:XP_001306647.1 hypothetical protein [Trichomonas vaginalis G3]